MKKEIPRTGDQIRAAFLDFFAARGHLVVPSSSLVPKDDPTLLFTTAGMVQFKPYFMGEATPPGSRLASCQKCFRTTDIEAVGDPKHLTFFEMLGNFSVGDYFKEGAIEYAWEFVTQVLHLPPEKLWITIFTDDEEAFGHWRRMGMPEERILRYGEAEGNFWGPAGDSGPCGPCSEIHFDFGEEMGCHRPTCGPSCDCPRFLEIWNLVFMQYYQDVSGRRTPLSRTNIDTGMGLERAAAVMQGKMSAYETDLFTPLMEAIQGISGMRYGKEETTDRAMRAVADHSRAITFLLAEGVMPSNEGRGYVLRRVLRRAVRMGKTLGREEPFLRQMAEVVIARMSPIYPELKEASRLSLRIIHQEEERFAQTLTVGLRLLEDVIQTVKTKSLTTIPGREVFHLYDTYGFPPELTAEIAGEHGLAMDWDGFEREMDAQRSRARAAHTFVSAREQATKTLAELGPTVFKGYEELRTRTFVQLILLNGETIEAIKEGQEAEVVLPKTPFYAERGGQVGDRGEIWSSSGRFIVEDTTLGPGDVFLHRGRMTQGTLAVGQEVEAMVDGERRWDIRRNHTATHLLHAALRQVLGSHARQSGSLVAPDRLRFDFAHMAAPTPEELAAVQRLVNEKIRQDLPVVTRVTTYSEAIAQGAIALFDEKYGDEVRMVTVMEGDSFFSAELCGGTHVERTGQIGMCLIVSESSIGVGMRRLEAVTGRGAEALLEERLAILDAVAQRIQAPPADVPAKLASLLEELEQERKRAAALKKELARRSAESLLAQVKSVDGMSVVAAQVPSSSLEALREMADFLRQRLGSGVVVLGTVYNQRPHFLVAVTHDLTAKGVHAAEIVKKVAAVTGGRGGGTASMAQAGGKDTTKLEEALRSVPRLLQQ
ncbi:MAG: alanine--tRNA ligase [Chloroflexi bacterium]|nr:alanine--tRNA ligase [Chloroflexota bacterium]